MTVSDPYEEPSAYKSVIKALQYLAFTRLDISFIVSTLSQFLHSFTIDQWEACKRVLRYLKATINHGLKLQANTILQVQGFADSNWASNVDDRKYVNGYCIYFGTNLILWNSKKQQVVARSSIEVEHRALALQLKSAGSKLFK